MQAGMNLLQFPNARSINPQPMSKTKAIANSPATENAAKDLRSGRGGGAARRVFSDSEIPLKMRVQAAPVQREFL